MDIVPILLLILFSPFLIGAGAMFGWMIIYYLIVTPWTLMCKAIRHGFKSGKFKEALADKGFD